MRAYEISKFDLDSLRVVDRPDPQPGANEVVLDVRALSLNYRDLLVIRGLYNSNLPLPMTPISDGAGVVTAVGAGVSDVRVGDRVMGQFVTGWRDGPFHAAYLKTTLGGPGPGLAAERVALPAAAVVPIPESYDFAQAATLPIAALTAWSALVTEGRVQAGQIVLTLGTGGVAIFTLQIASALGAEVIITSSSDEKLARATALGATHTINYATNPNWHKRVLELTDGVGVDVTVETAGAGTLEQSLSATRAGGVVAVLGALTGLKAQVSTGAIMMKRLKIAGVMVDCKAAFLELCAFLAEKQIQPVIDARFPFEELRGALDALEQAQHVGKIVVERNA